ncbi:MAG TPA: hemolysin family protein [Anaerolineaceae bacterium]|nr:hemolysin family protein [Anaerolineaceae bacterium]
MELIAWILLGVFLLLDFFISVTRAALFNARLPQLIDLGTENRGMLERTIKVLETTRLRATMRFLVAMLHGLVLASVWILLEAAGVRYSIAGLLGIFALTVFILLAFEFLVERFPLKNPETWAMRLAPIANFLDQLFSPFTSLLVGLQGTGGVVQRNFGAVTEDELKTWVEVGEPEGGLEPDERKMIYSIFQFGETLCREIMVPRIEVLALDVNTPLHDAINQFVESGHSRAPVYEDVIDNVVGLLYAKDLLKLHTTPAENQTIRKFLRPAYFVPESKKVDELLAEMQARGIHLAVVVDEYGGMAGLVTLEDIVEEIVGEIRDEYDQSEERLVEKISDEEFVFLGRVALDDFNDALNTELQTDQTDTLGGYFYSQEGRVPVEGDVLIFDGWRLTVEEVHGRRVGRIRALRMEKQDEEDNTDG